ncbi:hypothetical protein LEP1GSC127_2773 [Leptospira kirschneri str. 200801925]|nr:hypothetical protein LEP1GSC127_2773 [Leptospira kirschneri str. 200801925]
MFPILFVIGIRLLFIRKLLPPISRFLIFGALFFYWMATDSSLSMIFPWLHAKWHTALNVSLVFLTLSSLVTARFFLKNLPPGKWKLWGGLVLFILGLYRFIVTIPGPATGIETFTENPSAIWEQKKEWTHVFEKTSYGALIASEEILEEKDSRWASVLIRQSVRRNIVLRNRFEKSFPSSIEEIFRLFPEQGTKPFLNKEEKQINPAPEKEKLSELFFKLLSERGVSYVLLGSDSLNQLAIVSPKFFSKIDQKGKWILWKLNSSRSFMELLPKKPIAILKEDFSFQKFKLKSALDLKFEQNLTLIPVSKEEFKSDENSFSDFCEVSSCFKEKIKEKENFQNKTRTKTELVDLPTEIWPVTWSDSEIKWEIPKEKQSEACFPILVRSGFFPLWKLVSGEKVYRTLEDQFYFCSKERKNEFIFYDIRTYLITFVQLLLPLAFFGATFLTRRKISN